MTAEKSFETAAQHASAALEATEHLPHGHYRDYARDNLKAAIGWIKQARDEWAEREAGQ